ncbi:hypothetical protein DPMN_000749 [Dreissena polymorpha]|uniref:Uncharacterized protein n=1 Tax=Dreissena polymorpha TaxID=45954 RepID=A0A9D4MKC7_DREPO|nr:hypothetical protein DPMN_000749 [Dreissena polymorpha]
MPPYRGRKNEDIIRSNVLTMFHEEINSSTPGGHIINAVPRVLPRTNALPHIMRTNVLTKKNAPPPGGYVFQSTKTIFELFYEYTTINVASRVLTRKNAAPSVLTKFHEDRIINFVSMVLTRTRDKIVTKPGFQLRISTCFSTNWNHFTLVQDIIRTNLLTKFHEDRTLNVVSRENALPPGGHVFQPTGTIFKLVQDIIGTNLLTKFHDDQTINVSCRVLTSKNAPPLGGHTVNVASRVLTRKNTTPTGSHAFFKQLQMLTPHDGQKGITKVHQE